MTANGGALGLIEAERRRLSSEGPCFTRADGDFEQVLIPEGDGDVLRDLLISESARTVIEIG
jgi:hypothetical protein